METISGDFLKRFGDYFHLEKLEEEALLKAQPIILRHIPQAAQEIHEYALSFPEVAKLYKDDGAAARAREGRERHFQSLFTARRDEAHFRDWLKVGEIHDKIGLEPRWYISAYAVFLQTLLAAIQPDIATWTPEHHMNLRKALVKLLLLDIALAWEAYLHIREERIAKAYQQLVADHNLSLKLIVELREEKEKLAQTLTDVVAALEKAGWAKGKEIE